MFEEGHVCEVEADDDAVIALVAGLRVPTDAVHHHAGWHHHCHNEEEGVLSGEVEEWQSAAGSCGSWQGWR